MSRLTKYDAEALLRGYDADPVDALLTALRVVTNRPEGTWPELVHLASADPDRRTALEAGDPFALDALVAELNELRTLDARRLAREAASQLS